MSYVDAGYCAALGTLFAYAALLVYRFRRLSRTAASIERPDSQRPVVDSPLYRPVALEDRVETATVVAVGVAGGAHDAASEREARVRSYEAGS